MFDHAGRDLDQALADGRELGTGERVCRRDRTRTLCISSMRQCGMRAEPDWRSRCQRRPRAAELEESSVVGSPAALGTLAIRDAWFTACLALAQEQIN